MSAPTIFTVILCTVAGTDFESQSATRALVNGQRKRIFALKAFAKLHLRNQILAVTRLSRPNAPACSVEDIVLEFAGDRLTLSSGIIVYIVCDIIIEWDKV